jgi:hypothetical protein
MKRALDGRHGISILSCQAVPDQPSPAPAAPEQQKRDWHELHSGLCGWLNATATPLSWRGRIGRHPWVGRGDRSRAALREGDAYATAMRSTVVGAPAGSKGHENDRVC